jgi:phage tail-like protein
MARSSTADPLEKFRFIVEFSADATSEATVLDRAGFLECGMPKRTTNKISYREGNMSDISTQSAGLSTMDDVTLTRGLIAKVAGIDSSLYKWMTSVHNPIADVTGSVKTGVVISHAAAKYRKDITIKVLDRTGALARTYKLYQAWPVAFAPGSDLNAAEDGDKMIESITLAYEDFAEIAAVPSASLSPTAAAL